jgi:Leucine-rich repeat (LRR) protein
LALLLSSRAHSLPLSFPQPVFEWQRLFDVPDLCILNSLRIVGCGMTYVPESIPPYLQELENLCLDCNSLETLPPNVGDLGQTLETLRLQKNKLRYLPDSFGKLINLIFLDLTNNKLEALPPDFNNLHKLPRLELEKNELTSLPAEIGRMNCSFVNLNKNKLTCLVLRPHHEIMHCLHLSCVDLHTNYKCY